MRAPPPSAKLKILVFAVFTRYRRTTSPTAASPENAVSPLMSITLPNRPIATKFGPERWKGAIFPSSMSTSSSVMVVCRSVEGQ
jgi:hypothetical protein